MEIIGLILLLGITATVLYYLDLYEAGWVHARRFFNIPDKKSVLVEVKERYTEVKQNRIKDKIEKQRQAVSYARDKKEIAKKAMVQQREQRVQRADQQREQRVQRADQQREQRVQQMEQRREKRIQQTEMRREQRERKKDLTSRIKYSNGQFLPNPPVGSREWLNLPEIKRQFKAASFVKPTKPPPPPQPIASSSDASTNLYYNNIQQQQPPILEASLRTALEAALEAARPPSKPESIGTPVLKTLTLRTKTANTIEKSVTVERSSGGSINVIRTIEIDRS